MDTCPCRRHWLHPVISHRLENVSWKGGGPGTRTRKGLRPAVFKTAALPIRGDSRFGTWLHSIAVSVTLNGLRRVKRNREREFALDDARQVAGRADVGAEVRSRLKEAIDALPELYRTVFLMHDLEGYSHNEIATALDMAEGTSKARLVWVNEGEKAADRMAIELPPEHAATCAPTTKWNQFFTECLHGRVEYSILQCSGVE